MASSTLGLHNHFFQGQGLGGGIDFLKREESLKKKEATPIVLDITTVTTTITNITNIITNITTNTKNSCFQVLRSVALTLRRPACMYRLVSLVQPLWFTYAL